MPASTESLAEARGGHARVPEFFIVGHHKCGTTALYEMLSRHPRIFMPAIKEPRFLASDLRSRFQPPLGRAHVLPETLAEYLELFAPARADQRVGEATPAYLYSHTAAARIAELQPAARSIAILREPAAFLRSLHLQLLRSHVESEKDLRKALELQPARRAGDRIPSRSHLPQLLSYSDHVAYVEQLRRYHAVFPAEQVLVLIYDDFRADNRATLERVLRFLDVEDHPLEEANVKQTTRAIRSQRLDDALHGLTLGDSPVSRTARSAIKALTPRRARRELFNTMRARAVLQEAPPPDERLMDELRARFKPEVVALSEYLGRDLVKQWGYDRVG
jgi:hypothetical protein